MCLATAILVSVLSIYRTATVALKGEVSSASNARVQNEPVDGEKVEIKAIGEGQRYSARVCNLLPAWGADASSSSCVGQTPVFSNTTATHLTCANEKPLMKNRGRPGVTIALLYFAKPALLFRQLEVFATYPEQIQKELTILIIDDGSPPGLRASEYLNTTSYQSLFKIRLARITTERDWNIGGARNLAFYLVDTFRTLLLDLDIIIPWKAMQESLSWPLYDSINGTQLAHRFNRRRADGSENKHPAVCMIRTDAYWENGGCDEDFCGSYGFTDIHFWYRWKADKSKTMIDHLETFIEEFEMPACDPKFLGDQKSLICKEQRAQQTKPNRNLKKNHALYKEKTKKGCWSNKYLKFRWIVEAW